MADPGDTMAAEDGGEMTDGATLPEIPDPTGDDVLDAVSLVRALGDVTRELSSVTQGLAQVHTSIDTLSTRMDGLREDYRELASELRISNALNSRQWEALAAVFNSRAVQAVLLALAVATVARLLNLDPGSVMSMLGGGVTIAPAV